MGVVFGQNLGQVRSNVLKKSQETGIINRFFPYFAQGIHFIARRVVIQAPKWKFEELEMPYFKDDSIKFLPNWVKQCQKLIIFKNFTLVSQS